MTAWQFILWMLPWLGLAIAIVYVGYVAYQTAEARARYAAMPKATGPDPAEEMERINTEMARVATQSRQMLEAARESMRKGLRG